MAWLLLRIVALLVLSMASPAARADAVAGKTYWGNNCTSCHGQSGSNSLANLVDRVPATGTVAGVTYDCSYGNTEQFANRLEGHCNTNVGNVTAMRTLAGNPTDLQNVLDYFNAYNQGGTLTTNSQTFGRLNPGVTGSRTLTLTNLKETGSTYLVSSTVPTGYVLQDSSSPTRCRVGTGATLAANASCEIVLEFGVGSTSTTSGALNATVNVTMDGKAFALPFSGTINERPTASASASSTSVVAGSSIQLLGSGSDADGSIASYVWTLSPTLAGFPSTQQNPTLTPPAGTYTASLVVTDSEGLSSRNAATVTITVAAPTPSYADSRSLLTSFTANVLAGAGHTHNQSLVLCNGALTGTACASGSATGPMTVSGLPATLGEFAIGSGCNTTLSPGQSCTVTLGFTPTAQGDRSQTLTFTAAGASRSIVLAATGLQPRISAVPSNAPTAQVGTSTTLDVTVRNFSGGTWGNAPLQLTGIALDGAGSSGDFELDPSVPGQCTTAAPVAANSGTCSVRVIFHPQVAGARSTTLRLTSNAGPELQVTVQGTGSSVPVLTYVPGSLALAFSALPVGTTGTPQSLAISNPRATEVTYTLGAVAAQAGTPAGDFQVVDDGGNFAACQRVAAGVVRIAAGGTCTVRVVFRPQPGATGPRAASLPIAYTAAALPAPDAVQVSLSGTAQPAISMSATDLSLGAIVGQSAQGAVLLSNASTSTFSIGSVTLGGADASQFALVTPAAGVQRCDPGLSLAAGASCSITVAYRPTESTAHLATVTVTHSAGDPLVLRLHGSGQPVPQGRLLTVAAVDAGTVQVASAVQRSITLRNGGDAPLNFAGFDLGGAAAADWQLVPPAAGAAACATGTPLAPSQDCLLGLQLRPSMAGTRAATLTIRSDGADPALVVALTGQATAIPVPVLAFADAAGAVPASMDFGAQTMGGIYPARTVDIVNAGTAPMAISLITVTGAGFTLADAGTCSAGLAPGARCTVRVAFVAPAADAAFSGRLTVADDAAGAPHGLSLAGRGVAAQLPVLAWETPPDGPLDFGSVSAGSSSDPQVLVLRNPGRSAVAIGSVRAVGADAAVFSTSSSDPAACRAGLMLAVGEGCRVEVRFLPGAGGDRAAMLDVLSSGVAPPAIGLRGTGLASAQASAALSATALDFGSSRIGDRSLPRTLTLASSGTTGLRVTALTVEGAFVVTGGSCPAAPFTLDPGVRCTMTLTAAPAAEGSLNGALVVASDAGTRRVALSVRGDPAPQVGSGASGGGCSMISTEAPVHDPTLWVLTLWAAAALVARARRRSAVVAAADEASTPCDREPS